MLAVVAADKVNNAKLLWEMIVAPSNPHRLETGRTLTAPSVLRSRGGRLQVLEVVE